MWKIKSGIPYCEKCGYTPPLIGFIRECGAICPQCGDSMLPDGVEPINAKYEPMSDKELMDKLKVTYAICCHERKG